MDANPLTPNRIERLINLAEDRSLHNVPRRLVLDDEDLKRLTSHPTATESTTTNTNSSSGILDLEKVEGFGDSVLGMSLSKSTAFNPGELTGRSTGADDINNKAGLARTQVLDGHQASWSTTQSIDGRHSIAIDSLLNDMDKQTTEVNDILRHSIATNFSLHSKNLTADETSFIRREAPLPVHANQHKTIDSMVSNTNNMSMGTYFLNRCPDFGAILGKTESPDRSCQPSITEVSSSFQMDQTNPSLYKMDQLDSVPVKQPRNPEKMPEKNVLNSLNNTKTLEKRSNFGARKDIQNIFSGMEKQDNTTANKMLDKPKPLPKAIQMLTLENCSKLTHEDTKEECSFSISRIQEFLEKQSITEVSVSDIIKLSNNKNKQPLTEVQMNIPEVRPSNTTDFVTQLKDTKNMAASSTAGSVNTVISVGKDKGKETKVLPTVLLTEDTLNFNKVQKISMEDVKEPVSVRSKSPSSNSQSTLSTVQDNFASFKYSDSPSHSSKGEVQKLSPNNLSSNNEYKELDKSVNWHELLRHKHLNQSLAKEIWADISVTTARGYVGVSCPVTVTTTLQTDTWLTAKFQFDELPNDGKDLTIELPRFPLLLAPGKSEQFNIHITSNVEISTTLPFTMVLRDASIDLEKMQRGNISIDIKMPVVQAMSSNGINKVTFPPIQEKIVLSKAFVLISDCEVDLQLDLSVVEGDSLFAIKNVQEIKKSDVNKVLMEHQGFTEEIQGKAKSKGNKQLCRLTTGNAIRVTITFKAPKLSDIQLPDDLVTFNGALNVNLYGLTTTLRKVDLIGTVGSVNLVVPEVSPGTKLEVSNEPTNITVRNTGTIQGMWFSRFGALTASGSSKIPFKVSPSKFDLRPGESKTLAVVYTGSEDCVTDAILNFEDVASGYKTKIEIVGGSEKLKKFPVKCSYNILSYVRPGRKELSLRNAVDKKIHVKCFIRGEGFSLDLPGGETRGPYMVPFTPNETRLLPVIFNPSSCAPHFATLHLTHDKNSEFSRSVRLYGCASGEPVRWHGLVTYGHMALVRAAARRPVELGLFNKCSAPAFVCATLHFHLQFLFASSSSVMEGARRVVGARSKHELRLVLDWPRVERRARDCSEAALATVTVLTGAELTRRRILRVLRNEAGELDASLLPEHLRVLTDQYEGEDPSMDEQLAEFNETKSSLNELLGGLHELKAQIDLPQDFADENTIIICDDTVVEHHTLLD